MELDKTLFKKEAVERLDAEFVEKARMVIFSDDAIALDNLFQIVGGYAGHLTDGMVSAGFPETEAKVQGWQAAWSKLRRLLDQQTHSTQEVAAYLERNMGNINPDTVVTDSGEPLDSAT